MSYDMSLTDPVSGETLLADVPHDMRGGTYAMGGTQELWLNITYNYSRWYAALWPEKGIETIVGMTGGDSLPVLRDGIERLSDESFHVELEPDEKWLTERNEASERITPGSGTMTLESYWCPTRANALRPLYQLIALAQIRPDGVWDGD